jgi:dihydroneopterin aldolase
MRDAPDLTVVKLGGSQAFSNHLPDWLDALAHCAGRVVVAPGGGPFADAVRTAQPKMGFDDDAAHHMALLAMDQYGRALVSLNAAFALADSASAIGDIVAGGKVPVWSPTAMVLAAKDIPYSWQVTGDSLAAWLAGHIGAKRLLLVKHVELSSERVAVADLVARGIVDPAFPRFFDASGVEASIIGPAGHAAVAAALRSGAMIGRRIVLERFPVSHHHERL